MRNDPIGLMDSGVGRLTVLKEIQRLLPTEKTVYLGDQGRLPYGPRSAAEVTAFTRQIAAYLRQKHHIKLLVIACNTATAAALPTMQAELPIPVVGVISPGARAGVQATRNHQIGVIATAGTVKSDQYRQQILAKDARNTVVSVATPELVTLAEQNDLVSAHAQEVVTQAVAPLKNQGIDTLVLGCTHFPLLRQAIQGAVGSAVHLVNPGTATAAAVTTLLDYWNLANDQSNDQPTAVYYTTGDADRFDRLANQWLNRTPVQAIPVTIQTLERAMQTTEGE